MKKFLVLIIIALLSTQLNAEDKKESLLLDGWTINGLAFMTYQMDGKDFNDDTDMVGDNILKLRLGAEKEFSKDIIFHIEFQDSRVMFADKTVAGNMDVEDDASNNSSNNFGLFQGYLEVKNILGTKLGLKAGRFQMDYGDGRYLGSGFWSLNEIKHDGIRAQYKCEKITADVFYTRHNSLQDQYYLKTLRSYYPLESADNFGNDVVGFWGNMKINKTNTVDLFAFMESNTAAAKELSRTTLGLNYNGKFGAFSAFADFAMQLGTSTAVNEDEDVDNVETDINAYHAALKLSYMLKPIKLSAGMDMFSGQKTYEDGEDMQINTFSNLLGSKHKFLGMMDYFLVLGGPTGGTGNLGVNDFYFCAAYPKITKKLGASVTYHLFMSNQPGINAEDGSEFSDFGSEIDFVLTYKVAKGFMVKGGAAVFMQGDLMKQMWTATDGTVREDMPIYAFLMIVAKL
ncbi:MAG: alginate export family protein [Chlorobi bacterium]|nr:alginate export family protein [Chlorobiota bacterium]